jgi:hypothetical protein
MADQVTNHTSIAAFWQSKSNDVADVDPFKRNGRSKEKK